MDGNRRSRKRVWDPWSTMCAAARVGQSVASICGADTGTGCIKQVMAVKRQRIVHGGDPRASRNAAMSDGAARVGKRCGPAGDQRRRSCAGVSLATRRQCTGRAFDVMRAEGAERDFLVDRI